MAYSPPPPPPPPPLLPSSSQSTPSNPHLSMLYYGLAVVATATIVLVLYNFIVMRLCGQNYSRSREDRLIWTLHNMSNHAQNQNQNQNRTNNPDLESYNIALVSSFKYKKGGGEIKNKVAYDSNECSVCLSTFEEGEEMRELPSCKHSFHVPCIDMWLYSHSDCPVCRAKLVVVPQQMKNKSNELPIEVLIDPSTPA